MWWRHDRLKEFERLMLPSLPAAHRLACAIVRDRDDAADVVQDAYLRAFAAFAQFRGGSANAWLLAIVRNTALAALRSRVRGANVIPFDSTVHAAAAVSPEPSPEVVAQHLGELDRVRRALDDLPTAYREVVLLRDVEGLSYREIACVVDAPVGTVMSRLYRGRTHLRAALADAEPRERRE